MKVNLTSINSRDPTTFQTPLGALRNTRLVMGHTNSVQVMQGNIDFTLQEEIPAFTIPFVDDVPVKGPTSRYALPDGTYETIPENPSIRRFVWEHFNNVNLSEGGFPEVTSGCNGRAEHE